jgi:hypothetical protein
MRLYHYTSTIHLPYILEAGVLLPTESNVSILREHAGPDVVWLLDRPLLPGENHGLQGSYADKTAVCITVEVPTKAAVRWLDWKPQKGMDPAWRSAFVRAGGGHGETKRWWVVTRPIPRDEWVEITVDGPTTHPAPR